MSQKTKRFWVTSFFFVFFFSFNCLNSDKAFQCETEQTYKQNKKKTTKIEYGNFFVDLSPKIIRLHQTCIRDVFERFVKKNLMANYLPMASLRVPVAKLLVIDHPIAVNSRYWFNFGCIFQNNC